MNNSENEQTIIEVFKYLYDSSDYELYDDDELNDNINYNYSKFLFNFIF